MKILFIILAFLVILISCEDIAEKGRPFTRCDAIPLVKFDYEMMKKLDPFYVTHSNIEAYNCTQIILLGFAGTNLNYTGTVLLYSKNETLAYDFKDVNHNIFRYIKCSDGLKIEYRIVSYNVRDHSNARVCSVVCDPTGHSVQIFSCIGRTPSDILENENYIKTFKGLNTVMTGTIFPNYLNCEKPKFCYAFY